MKTLQFHFNVTKTYLVKSVASLSNVIQGRVCTMHYLLKKMMACDVTNDHLGRHLGLYQEIKPREMVIFLCFAR